MRVILLMTVIALTAFAACRKEPGTGTPSAGPAVGQPAPEIEGPDQNGETFKLSDYRGKVVVLDFWADW